jgi:surface protein
MRITQQNIRAELGYQPNNKFYQAVQNTLDNFLHVDVLRVGEVGSSQEVINATYESLDQTMTVTGDAGLFVETKDINGNVLGSGIIGPDGTVTYAINTAGQVNNAPIYTKSDLSNTVSHFLVIPSNEIPSNEMHFTTLAGSVDYLGTQGDQILLSDGTTVLITATDVTVTFNAPAGKHIVKLVESVGRNNYVSVGGGALVELHNFPTLSTVTKFNFATYNYNPLHNLTKVPNILPSNITNMAGMFYIANSFNQDISMWDVSNVTNMVAMFRDASAFNQPLNNWNVSNVTNMGVMFYTANSFNQPLNNWNVANVTNMSYMFYVASSFNQDLSNWCVSNFPTMPDGFNTSAPFLAGAKLPVWGTCPTP